MLVNSFQFEDSIASSGPQTPTRYEKPVPLVKVAPNPEPEASPKPYTTDGDDVLGSDADSGGIR